MWQKCKADSPMCVEVNILPSCVNVRDSKDPGIGHGTENYLSFTRKEWQAFIDGVKRGEFDLR